MWKSAMVLTLFVAKAISFVGLSGTVVPTDRSPSPALADNEFWPYPDCVPFDPCGSD